MRKSVRERVWDVLVDWAPSLPSDGGVCMFWRDRSAPAELAVRVIGFPKKELIEYEGLWLTASSLTSAHDIEELEKLASIDTN
jgi:CRISPR-associated protein Cas2